MALTNIARPLAFLILPLSLLPATAVLAQSQQQGRDGSHDMDFSQGSWRTDVTIYKDPFSVNSPQVHMKGTKVARPIWKGKAWIEEIEADGPQGNWEATNVFLYDPTSHQWSENYADADTGRFDGTPGIGSMRDGHLEFYSQQPIGGRVYLVRGVWNVEGKDSHTYTVSRSDDGGRTWHTSFVAKVSRDR